MNSVDFFKQIANNVPRCSFHAKAMKEKLITYSRDLGYEVLEDDAGNLLARKHKHAKLALQSHYDIVCVGPQPPKLIEENGWIRADGSSIGADNGVGVGLMMSLMQDYDELEYLFTNDEEVGLLGAKDMDLNLNAKKLINFDGFTEGEIVIGCAGSVHLKLSAHMFETTAVPEGFAPYEVLIDGLPGGHSGLDIDKNIPSAIVELFKALKESDALLVKVEGGEKLNSISVKAKALIWAKDISSFEKYGLKVTKLEKLDLPFKDSKKFIDAASAIKSGQLSRDMELGVVETSANIGLLRQDEKGLHFDVYIRSMKDEEQTNCAIEIAKSWESFGFESVKKESHSAWTPYMSPLALDVKIAMKRFYHQAAFTAVHAGLECAIFYDKFPGIELASIGPNIKAAHSIYERLEVASLERTESVIRSFLKDFMAS